MASCYNHFHQTNVTIHVLSGNAQSFDEFSLQSQGRPLNLLVVNGNLLYLIPETSDLEGAPIEETNKDQAFGYMGPGQFSNQKLEPACLQ